MKYNKLIVIFLIFGMAIIRLEAVCAQGVGSSSDVLRIIQIRHQALTKLVADKKLEDVHEQAFGIRDSAKELPSLVSSDKQSKVENTVANISKLAEELDKSGDAGNQAATEANLKKMDALLKMLSTQVS